MLVSVDGAAGVTGVCVSGIDAVADTVVPRAVSGGRDIRVVNNGVDTALPPSHDELMLVPIVEAV